MCLHRATYLLRQGHTRVILKRMIDTHHRTVHMYHDAHRGCRTLCGQPVPLCLTSWYHFVSAMTC